MIMPKTDDTSQIIPEVFKCIETVGTSRTLEALKEARNKSISNNHIENHIVKLCCNHYKFATKKDMFQGTTKSFRSHAMTVCFVLLEKHLNYTQDEIAKIAGGKHRSLVSRYMKWFRGLDPKIPIERDLMDSFMVLDELVLQYIEQSNKKNNV